MNFKKDGTYTVTVTGDLTVKETTNSITTPATIVVSGGKLTASANFEVNLPSFSVMADGKKVAKDAKIAVAAELN